MTLSVCILTFNEEKNIRKTIENVLLIWLVKEILIIDSWSTDSTLEIWREYSSVRIISHPLDSFAEQRNIWIQESTGSWILMIDADERLDNMLVEEIREILNKKPLEESKDLYFLPRKNFFMNTWILNAYPDFQWRFFKNNSEIRYSGSVHEQIGVEQLKTGKLRWNIIHMPDQSFSYHFNKIGRYTDKELDKHNPDSMAILITKALWLPFAIFCYSFFYKSWFKSGIAWFCWATLNAIYKLVEILKRIDAKLSLSTQ